MRERPDLYKKEAEIFMDVSVLIGKPLGALQPSPPITAREEVNIHSETCGEERRWPASSLYPATLSEAPRYKTDLPSSRLQHC